MKRQIKHDVKAAPEIKPPKKERKRRKEGRGDVTEMFPLRKSNEHSAVQMETHPTELAKASCCLTA